MHVPTMETFLYFAIFIMATFLVIPKLVIHYRSRLTCKNWPPSPPSLPIVGHLHHLKLPLHLSLLQLADRYGPVVFLRMGSRPALVVSSPTAAEEIFTKKDPIFANHPSLIVGKLLGYNNTSIFFAPYGKHWRNLRRIAAVELLSTTRLNILSGIRAEEILGLVKRLLKGMDLEGRGEVELRLSVFEMMYNAISKVVAGKRYYGDDVNAMELEEARRFREIIQEVIQVVFAFNPGDFFPVLESADIRGLGKKMVKLKRKVDGFADSLIEEHRSMRRRNGGCGVSSGATPGEGEERRRKTLINVLLSLQESDPHYYTDDIIKGLIMTLLIGGTDILAEMTESAMLLLLSHPEILRKARAEVDMHVGKDRILDESDLPKLPYLHCIIQETLRISPPQQGMSPRESSEDCTIQGFHVPRGTMVFVNVWAIQRDPKLWDEPTRFKPERFSGGKGGKEGLLYFPFGSGKRICPGESLAMRMLGFAVGSLVQCFEWEIVGAEEADLSAVIGLSTRKTEPFVAKYRRRDSMINTLSQL